MTDQQDMPKPSASLTEIFTKINMCELPAMSHNVQDLISLTKSSRSGSDELTRVILKDFSLTNKVLQIVNSAYYSMGRTCNSISKAVTILGFDAVRDMAMAIALFEDFIKSGGDKEGITKILTRSFLSGLQARDLVVGSGINVPPEEVFICTLLHNLGKIIVCIYLPDKYREIEEKIVSGLSQNMACRAVLSDITYQEIGVEVAKFWNLSERVIVAMDQTPEAPRHKYDSERYLQNLSHFSNSFVDKVCDGEDLEELFQQYGGILSVEPKDMIERLTEAISVSETVSDAIRFGLTKLKIKGRLRNVEANVKRGVLNSDRPDDQKERKSRTGQAEGEQKAETEVLDELPISTDKSVNDFIRDITETLMGHFDLNDFYANLLEALYRGIGFDRVILAIISRQPAKVSLVGRFGLGEIDSVGVRKFEHILASQSPYAVSIAVMQAKDMMISANKPGAFPDDLQYLVKDRTVYLFPITIDGKGIGLIYLDRKAARPLLDREMVKSVRLFRDFAVMAIRKIRKS